MPRPDHNLMSTMSKGNKVRCVLGPAAGDEIWIKGPYFDIPEHPDMAVCPTCEPADFIGEESFHTCRYKVHKFAFGSGHNHLYAAPENIPAVAVLNELWHTYKSNNGEQTMSKPTTAADRIEELEAKLEAACLDRDHCWKHLFERNDYVEALDREKTNVAQESYDEGYRAGLKRAKELITNERRTEKCK